jgi:DNA-binding response OmpR family regulator
MRLLLVEDDLMIGESLQSGLRDEGYAVDWVRDGAEAQATIEDAPYELVLLDLGLPEQDGLAVLRRYRRHHGTAPVLIITARDATAARVQGLDAGADDYLIKPFNFDELLARIRALLRRSAGQAQPELMCGNLRLNPSTHEVFLDDALIDLSPREFALLQILLTPPGQVVSRRMIEERLYGWDEEIGSNAVEVHIHGLRRKLGHSLIVNVRGVGYKVGTSP